MAARFQLGPWLVQPDLNAIVRNGNTIHLTPKVMGVLVCLAEHAGDAVSKEELIRTVWLDTFVTDDVIKGAISELRRSFDDDAREPRIIETIPKRGYRLIASVERLDDTPARAPAAKWRAGVLTKLAVVGVLAAAILASVVYFRNRQSSIDSIAVLPFASKNTDADSELGEGITTGLIDSLSQIPNLRVMSRTSVSHYKGKDIDPRMVGRELHVQAVLTGSLVQSRDGLVLDAELVNASDATHIWGRQYNGKPSDVLALQSELARALSDKLRPRLPSEAKAKLANPGTSTQEAYALYVKGRYTADRWDAQDWEKALVYFQQAVEKDPTYPQAYAGVGEAYVFLGEFYRSMPLREGIQKARAAGHRALELDPNLAEGHCALGGAAYVAWQWQEAEEETRRCVELNSNLSIAHQWRSNVLGSLGGTDHAVTEIKRALELDPLSFTSNLMLAYDYYYSRDYTRAIEQGLKMIQVEPNHPELHRTVADSYLMKGEYDKAVEEYEKSLTLSGEADQAEGLRRAYAKGGFRGLLKAQIQLWSDPAKTEDYCPDVVAGNYAFLGDRESAFFWLDKAYADNDKVAGCAGNLLPVQVDPFLENIRPDPRYKAFLRRMGFPE